MRASFFVVGGEKLRSRVNATGVASYVAFGIAPHRGGITDEEQACEEK